LIIATGQGAVKPPSPRFSLGCGSFLATLPEWRHPFENSGIEEVTRPDRIRVFRL
jgi:hypothetical protein